MGAEQVRLRADLAASDRRGSAHEESRHLRQHDVRSALAAIRCAAGTLQRYDDRLAADQRVTLQTAVTSELQRLEQLIDPVQAPRAIVLFDAFPTAVGSGRVGALG
jgi:K+-sensing histidine kinase KdpD